MPRCTNCGAAVSDTAKVCGMCGAKIQLGNSAPAQNVQPVSGNTCPNCGAQVKPGAKVCGMCGTKLNAAANSNGDTVATGQRSKDFSLIGQFIHWNVLPGQIAVKIDESQIAAYGRVKGVNVQEGVRAMIFLNGKKVADLDPGTYPFKELGGDDFVPARTVTVKAGQEETPEQKTERKKGLWGNIVNFVSGIFGRNRAEAAGLTQRIPASIPPVSIVLIREASFPLIFDEKGVQTSTLSADVAVNVLCKITDMDSFYGSILLDKNFACVESISKEIDVYADNIIRSHVKNVRAEDINNNLELQSAIHADLQSSVSSVYPYISVEKVLKVSSEQKELEALRRSREELYVSEQELTELTRRNDFMNRMQDVNNAQALSQARTQIEFEAAMEKIDENHEMNKFEHEKFAIMLAGQRKLHEAQSEEELQAALAEIKKSGMLREDELENLEHNLNQTRTLRNLNDAQIIALATMENEHALAVQKANWEYETGKIDLVRKIELENIELEQQKKRDEYNWSNRTREDDYQFNQQQRNQQAANAQRMAEMDMDQKEQMNQMELLRQAQEIRNQRENEEHRRQQEALAAERAHEQQMTQDAQKHEEEMRRMFQTMSAEQIMAANPNLSPAAVEAMKAKYQADATAREAEAAIAQNGKMEALYAQMMAQKDSDKADQKDMMMQMMNMMNSNNQQNTQNTNNNMQQMMQMMMQMGMTGMQAAAGATQAANDARLQGAQNLANVYQQNAAQNRADSNEDKDRFLAGMQTTIQSVGGAMQPQQVYVQAGANPAAQQPVQPVQPVPPVPPVQPQQPQATKAFVPAQETPAAPVAAVKACPICGRSYEVGNFCEACENPDGTPVKLV